MGGPGTKHWRRRQRSGRRVGRLRRAGGRVLVGLGIVLAVVWVVSGWFDIYRVWKEGGGAALAGGVGSFAPTTGGGGTWLAGVRFGGIEVNRYRYLTLTPGFVVSRREHSFRNGWFKYDTFNGMGQTEFWIYVPLWPVALGSVVGGVLLVRWGMFAYDRRAGRCAYCGYDLRGLSASAVCPECGEGGEAETEGRKLESRNGAA